MHQLKNKAILTICLTALLAALAVLSGCGGGQPTTTAQEPGVELPDDAFTQRALQVLVSTIGSGDYPTNSVTSISLERMLSGSTGSEVFLLDTRQKADFDRGHIAGSVQVDFNRWAAPENLARYPRDQKIVVIDYLDDYGGEVAGGLRMLGFDAIVLRGGINGWAQGFDQANLIQELAVTNYPVEIAPSQPFVAAPQGIPFSRPSAADYQLLAPKVNQLFSNQAPGTFNAITAAQLSEMLKTEEKDNLFILDIRQKADYSQGHIEGAINIPFQALGVPDNLERIPRDKKIVVSCYFGSSAGQVLTILRLLGYDAALLKHSMMSWNGFGKNTYLEYIQNANNPVVKTP